MVQEAQSAVTIDKEFHHDIFDLYKRSDGIVVRVSHDDAWYTIKEAKEFGAALHEITKGVPHLLLLIPGRRSSTDKEARSYMASRQVMRNVIAMATVIYSNTQSIIANLFQLIDKPPKPVKFFSDTSAAIEWLKKQEVTTPAHSSS